MKAAGKDAPDDEPITYQQIIEAVDLEDALWCCRAEPQFSREWRLFAVWCARQVQPLMKDKRSIDALDVAERYAHGQATKEELATARAAAALLSVSAAAETGAETAAGTAAAATWPTAWEAAWAAATRIRDASRAAQRTAFIQLVTTGKLPPLTKL